MKSLSDVLLAIAAGVLKDTKQAYPQMRGLDRDVERLTQTLSTRGIGLFTLDLPALDSVLTNTLESGRLIPKGYLSYSKGYPVPRLFAGLWMRIVDKRLNLRSDADVNAILFLRQLYCLGKKLAIPCSSVRTNKAIQEYIHVESRLPTPTLQWGGDHAVATGRRLGVDFRDMLDPDLPLYPEYNIGRDAGIEYLYERCQRIADYFAETLPIFCPDCFIEARRAEGKDLGLRHGPGAVAERSGKYFDKYRFQNWSAKLDRLYPFSTTGRMPLDPRVKLRNHEVPARLICVPKTAKGPRIIAAEPSEHMYTQNVLAAWLEEQISQSIIGKFVNFRDQSLSGKLVISSSLSKELSTLDLSSASDRLSLYVVERMFRNNPSILNAIHATRTRWLRLPNGECIKLKKFASQGTALTFPVQTICFLVIALAACSTGHDIEADIKDLIGKVRVFGDDIILPSYGYARAIKLLHGLHLKVNVEKSFSNGNFRESCGVDAFKGHDVTPCKPKTIIADKPGSGQAVLDTINNLFCKGFWNASSQLEHRQPSRSFKGYGLVGPDSGAAGLRSYSFHNELRRLVDDTGLLFGEFRIHGRQEARIRGHGSERQKFSSALKPGFRFPVHVLSILGKKIRVNSRLQHVEVARRTIVQRTTCTPYADGYSGLLQRQCCPTNPKSLATVGLEGVPERPRLLTGTRWVPITDLF